MFNSVITKLWVTISALVLTILLVFSLVLANRLENIYFSNQVMLMQEHARQWKKVILKDTPPEIIQREMEFWGGVSHYNIAVFDENEITQFSSDPSHIPVGQKSNWVHVRQGIQNREIYYTGYNPELKKEMTATFLSFENGSKRYQIMIHTPTNDLLEMVRATRTTGLAVLALFFLLSGALVLYLSRVIAKPLIDIRRTAMNMAKGDFSNLIKQESNDELGDLAKTMNILSIRLNKTLDSLSRTNEELSGLLERWKEFVADVSHELRTPLFLIQGYSEALSDNIVKNDETKREYLAVINKESLRLQKMVNDLLAVESGIPLKKTPTELFDLAAETTVPFEIAAREKRVTIDIKEELKNLGPVNIDPDKFGEVLYNLVDNALRYTQDGKIVISGEKVDPEKVYLKVSDTGTGIPEEHLPHLFDRFYRVDKTRSRANGGTGLGLAIVKKIVEQHGGTISVESESSRGTTFTITLPVE